jgi:hypothetical protein
LAIRFSNSEAGLVVRVLRNQFAGNAWRRMTAKGLCRFQFAVNLGLEVIDD